ncbi:rod-binding protein [Lentilitoribacter sp. EG35]|jgi:hypothetical protein|uniref:rod-binding protein n=1 Tax=Lentilitoribacter sp. EG35 TaxID=3234192 RepID=UPI00345F1887
MAISVNTDLVLDVLRAGNPERAAIADANLQTKKTSSFEIAAAGEKFATELAAKAAGSAPAVVLPKNVADMRSQSITQGVDQSFQKFEGVILEQFVKEMLPQDASSVFGEGTAGDIWKGMMAQQIGNTLAKAGGVGIAQQLQAQSENANQAANIIHTNERDILDTLDENPKP